MDLTVNQFNSILDFSIFNISRGKSGFRIFYQNIRSLKNKIAEIEVIINNYKANLVILSETWINDNQKGFYNINNYNSIYSCRKRQGGGLGLFLHDTFDYKIIDKYDSENHSCIIIKIVKLKLIVIAIYRPPSFNINEFLEFLDEKINSVLAVDYKCIIIGDMNIDLLNKNTNTERINDLYASYNFQLVNLKYPTRHCANSNSLLDHVAINFTNNIVLSIISNCLSDHDIQLMDIDLGEEKLSAKKTAKINFLKINYKLLDQELNTLEENLEANFSVHKLYDSIIDSFTNCTYNRTIKIKETKPWFNEQLYHLIKQRDHYFYRKRVYPNNEHIKNIYNKYNKLVKQHIRQAKRTYFENAFYNQNHKNVWKAINFAIYNKSRDKINKIKALTKNDDLIDDPKEICEYINTFFVTIGQELANKIPKSDNEYLDKPNQSSMFLRPTNENEIKTVISNLKSKKASGYDNISVSMIKKAQAKLATILKHLINKSFSTGTVPDASKTAKIIPIFKSGNKELVTNYRPISLLPILSKIIEKIMNIRLVDFLEKSSFLFQGQYGFRKNSNSETAVMDIISDIHIKLDKNENCGIISLDLCKAFDTVDHKILLSKMYQIGIRGNAYTWFCNYLSNRYQFVYANSQSSSYKRIVCGVPQGSVLAPSLFLIYINSICSLKLKGTIKLFADDTTIFYYGKNFREIRIDMISDLNKIHDWLKCNKLSLNFSKSNFMFISKQKIKTDKEPIIFSGNKINYSDSTKFLGLYIDECLTWKVHISKIKEKILPYIGIISKTRYHLPLKYLKLIYFSFIFSNLQYLASVWTTACNSDINQLRVLQNKAIKLMYKLPYLEPTVNLYAPNNLLNLDNLYKYKICCYIFSVVNRQKHSSLVFINNNNLHVHNTRQTNNLALINIRSNYGKKSVYFQGIKIYNNLPERLKLLRNIVKFKAELKQFLIHK